MAPKSLVFNNIRIGINASRDGESSEWVNTSPVISAVQVRSSEEGRSGE